MCGRFTYKFTWSEIHDHLAGFVDVLRKEVDPEVAMAPARYNIAPTQPILVMYRVGSDVDTKLMRWGLVPEWVKDPREFPLIVNARSETLREKASFRSAIKNRRCIVPASGYYEWLRKPEKKIPHYITYQDERPMLFAGLWSTWMGPDGEEIDTATIITVPANPELEAIHDRTPALLTPEQVKDWLDPSVNAEQAQAMLRPIPAGATKAHPVSPRVNSARNEGEDLIVPVFEEGEKPEGAASKADTKPKSAGTRTGQMNLFD